METEFERSFLDWSCEDVCSWLSTLALSRDYSSHFKVDLITGSTLISLDREALEDMGVIDDADRLKILQQITSMRADLMTIGSGSPTRRIRTPMKGRRFSDTTCPAHYSGGGRGPQGWRGQGSRQNLKMHKYVNVPVFGTRSPRTSESGTSAINSPSRLSTDRTSSDSQESSRISTPDKQLQDVVAYDAERRRGLSGQLSKLHAVATLRYHNVRRLSRSLDHLFQDGEDILSAYHRLSSGAEDRNEYSSNSRLVEILREENSSLKQELETYYQRVRKLQKIEQEVEGIREAHRILEASTVRREGLEKALRVKLEQEIRRLKEEGIKLKAELSVARKQTASDTPEKNGTSKREIRRRDTMIMRLIKQNQEAAMAREQLERDLHSTKARLKETGGGVVSDRTAATSEHCSYVNSDDSKTAILYSESIDKLKAVLSAMHNMSQKREKLEKKLRSQLESEIVRLREMEREKKAKEGGEESVTEKLSEMKLHNAALESDVVKWEHKCLELVAEKQMTFEVAVIPKEARIAALERSLAEKIDSSHELTHQKSLYLDQLTDANRHITELEIKLTSVQSSLQEKDSVIQMMQKSFLEPEDDLFQAPPSHLPIPPPVESSTLHHPPNHSMPLPPPYQSPPHPSGYPSHNLPPPPHHYFPTANTTSCIDASEATTPRDRAQSGSYVEVVPLSTPQQSSHWSVGPSPRSPGAHVPMRTLPLGGPSAVPQPSYQGKPFSPVKATGGNINGMRPKGTPSYPPQQEQIIRRNGHTQQSPPTNRYIPNSIHQHGSNSNSAPNSPKVKSLPRKPRISHPNMRLLQVPNSDYTPAAGGYRGNQTPNNFRRKCNTGPGGMRRHHKPLPSPRAVKSKTPPPDYRLVTVSSGGRSGGNKSDSPKLAPNKQRHHSVEDILSTTRNGRGQQRDMPLYNPDSLELFQSLIGDSNNMQAQNRGANSVPLGGSGEYESYGGHQHSKSSPSSNFHQILLS